MHKDTRENFILKILHTDAVTFKSAIGLSLI